MNFSKNKKIFRDEPHFSLQVFSINLLVGESIIPKVIEESMFGADFGMRQ